MGCDFQKFNFEHALVCLSRDGEDEVMGAWGVEDGSGWEAQVGSTTGETIFKARDERNHQGAQ